MPKMLKNTHNPPSTAQTCGVVMPISAIDSYPESHWRDVFVIISDAVKDAGLEAKMVSAADDVGIIQKRIIQNLYNNPIVICDVSAKNPNVMFELGLRLAFDKPTIIIKDDQTSYSFDTSPIEHIAYPRDLRYSAILNFKSDLTEKIKITLKKSKEDPNYSTFLKGFGEFKVAKIDEKEVSEQEFIADEIQSIKRLVIRLTNLIDTKTPDTGTRSFISAGARLMNADVIIPVNSIELLKIKEIIDVLSEAPGVDSVYIKNDALIGNVICVNIEENFDKQKLKANIHKMFEGCLKTNS